MQIDTAKLKVSTKAMVSAVLSLGALLQIPAVNKVFTSMADAHPRLAPAVGVIVTVWTLLHNPEVAAALGIQKTVEVRETTTEVALAEPTEVAK